MLLRFDFLSDNAAGACPEAMAAFNSANKGLVPGYGRDDITRSAADAIRRLLNCDAEVRFVATGTFANAIACATLCRPFEAVLAYEHAHIITHEAGAPGYFGQGLKLLPLPGAQGRIEADELRRALRAEDAANRQDAAALSITNATEYGTVYSADTVDALCAIAHEKELGVHLDGARLANAVAVGFDPKRLARAGVDILVLGGSKAGAPFSEAIILLNKAHVRRFDARLKQTGQLASKMRFLAAPWLGLLSETERGVPWIEHARHANRMAQKLAQSLPFPIRYPVETNSVFAAIDMQTHSVLAQRGWQLGRFEDGSLRFTCSWATSEEIVEALVHDLNELK